MSCCHSSAAGTSDRESIFTVDVAAIAFGTGVLREAGDRAAALGMTRVGVFTDAVVGGLDAVEAVIAGLRAQGLDVVLYDRVHVEPTDESFLEAAEFARDGRIDGYVSVGGGSVIDTAKAANLYATYPADLLDYVNAPIGRAAAVPGPLRPHIACPTTSGTGAECTGIAVFDLLSAQVKTGISSRFLRPTQALVDPTVTHTLPTSVLACSAFDVLSHALESYTARSFMSREKPTSPASRPMSQGANPWSDIGCEAALRLLGRYLERALRDADDHEARHQLMYAATLAGIAFGNAGVHIPHAMSYSVAGLVRDFRPKGYHVKEPMVPHGMSVIVNAPATFRLTAPSNPARHLEAASWLGADVSDASPDDAGEVLSRRLVDLMTIAGLPRGLTDLGYQRDDIAALVAGAWAQQRLLTNSPLNVTETLLEQLYDASLQTR